MKTGLPRLPPGDNSGYCCPCGECTRCLETYRRRDELLPAALKLLREVQGRFELDLSSCTDREIMEHPELRHAARLQKRIAAFFDVVGKRSAS